MSFCSAIACLVAIPFLPLPTPASWPCILLSAIIHVFYQLLLVRMYREGDFGVTYPVARGSSPLLISLGGAVLTAEYMNTLNVIGVILVSAGIFMLATGGHHLHRKSVPAALATGVSIAAYSLTDGLGVRLSGNAVAYTAWMMLLCGSTMPLVFMWLRKDGIDGLTKDRSGKDFVQVAGGGLISILGYGIVIWAMEHTTMGLVSALRKTSVLMAAILGRLLLGEAFTRRKAASAALIGAGAVCLH